MDLQESTFRDRPPGLVEPAPLPARSFDPDALTRALRIAGAILVVASASTFMLQHWQRSGSDLIRYAMLVGESLMLAAAAYFVGLSVREARSARTFLALVLAIIPVSFAVLGGLVYSQFHLEAVPHMPHYATWVAPSATSALLAVAGTLIVLVPLGVVSFTALARREARALSTAFFAANLLVLVPAREAAVVVTLAGLCVLALLRLETTRFAGKAQLDTLEGNLARAMVFVPPVIMLGRGLHLYRAGGAFVGGVLIIAAAAIGLVLPRVADAVKRDLGAWLASACGVAGWALCWAELSPRLTSGAAGVLLCGLPAAVVCGLGAVRATHSRAALTGIATTAALVTVLFACAVDRGTLSGVCCIVLGVGVAVWGASVRALVRTASGALVALLGLAVQVWLAVHHDNVLRWVSLSAVGILLIVGSAYVERNRGRVARFWQEVSARRVQAGRNI
ncbi:MAG TPA: hypothetical protein VI072_24070 [Polyangiaceae bacterium]